jgi:hypothetical protein
MSPSSKDRAGTATLIESNLVTGSTRLAAAGHESVDLDIQINQLVQMRKRISQSNATQPQWPSRSEAAERRSEGWSRPGGMLGFYLPVIALYDSTTV